MVISCVMMLGVVWLYGGVVSRRWGLGVEIEWRFECDKVWVGWRIWFRLWLDCLLMVDFCVEGWFRFFCCGSVFFFRLVWFFLIDWLWSDMLRMWCYDGLLILWLLCWFCWLWWCWYGGWWWWLWWRIGWLFVYWFVVFCEVLFLDMFCIWDGLFVGLCCGCVLCLGMLWSCWCLVGGWWWLNGRVWLDVWWF